MVWVGQGNSLPRPLELEGKIMTQLEAGALEGVALHPRAPSCHSPGPASCETVRGPLCQMSRTAFSMAKEPLTPSAGPCSGWPPDGWGGTCFWPCSRVIATTRGLRGTRPGYPRTRMGVAGCLPH